MAEVVKNKNSNNILPVVIIVIGVIVILVLVFGGGEDRQDGGQDTGADNSVSAVEEDGLQKAAILIKNFGYTPGEIVLQKGVETELTFIADGYSCAMAVASSDFWNETFILDFGDEYTVRFTPEEAGTFRYGCTMNYMYSGNIRVV